MTSRRRRALLGVAAAGAVVAAALVWSPWSGGSPDAPGTPGGTAARRAGGEDGSGSTATAAGIEGGTVRLGLAGPIVIDPPYASAAAPTDLMLLDILYDGLTRLAGDGSAAPAVAAGWTSDADQRLWRFSLDPDARFSTGRTVVAPDVVASLQHVMAGGDASPAALRLEVVTGFRDYVDGATPEVRGLRAIDDRTVEIALDRPFAQLPVLLAAPPYGVVDVPGLAAIAAGGTGTTLPGSATPAQFTNVALTGDWTVGEAGTREVRLDRRPGASGHLDSLVLRPFEDAEAAFTAFEDERVDWAAVPGDQAAAATEVFGSAAVAPFAAQLFLGLRVDAPALANVEFRRAIAMAIDRDAIVEAVYPDEADRLDGIAPRSLAPSADRGVLAQDVRLARALVQQAFPDGNVPTVHLDSEATGATTALMAVVARSLEAVGIPTARRSLGLDAYQRLLVSGQQELFTLSWLGGYRSAGDYLDPLLRSSSPDNLAGLRDPGMDRVLDLARAAADPAVAAQRWAEAERSALASAVLVPIAQFRTQAVVAERVLHLQHALDGTVDWTLVQVTG